jgi:DNA-binding NtrC family response regulator
VALAGVPVPFVAGRFSVPASQGVPERDLVLLDSRMVRLYEKAAAIAAGNISVLVTGETGTGKELLAEAIHRGSQRAQGTFLRLNCAAIAETLMDSELFGHERGSFTGAERAVPGLLESADGGTVFLDEVGETPPALQAKLLRVIESGEVLRVGARRPTPVDIRFVSATNRELDRSGQGGGLRGDLFYRLSGAVLRVPPLRERRCEIERLAHLFLHRAARMTGRQQPAHISAEALQWMMAYDWPGNIRELRNLIERATLLSRGSEIRLQDLLEEGTPGPVLPLARDPAPAPNERVRIISALERCGGNQTRAARLLGISRATLLRRIATLGLPRPRKRSENR